MAGRSEVAAGIAAATAVEGPHFSHSCFAAWLSIPYLSLSGGEAATAAGQNGADAAPAKAVAGEDRSGLSALFLSSVRISACS